MTLSDLVTDSYLAYRGKLSSVPAAGSEKYNRIVNIANRKQIERATDANIEWPDLFDIRTVGITTSSVQTYDLDDDIFKPSDFVQLVSSTNQTTYVPIVKPQMANRYSTGAYVTGYDPKQLTFIQTMTTSNDGYTIILPCYFVPADLVNPSDVVNPAHSQWLVYAVAAELARNDYAKEEQYGNLIGQANDLYQKMIADAQNSSFGQPNGVVNLMPQVAGLDYNQFSGYGTL